MIAANDLLKKLVADRDAQEQARKDADAAEARALLKSFDRHPSTVRKAQANVEALKAKMARAEADLAVAKANYQEAWSECSRLESQVSHDIQMLRHRAWNPARQTPARDRLMEYLDKVRQLTDVPIRRAHDLLVEAMHAIGAMGSGALDPVEDYEAFVDDAIARAEEMLAVAKREYREREAQEEKKKRVQKLLS